MAKKAQEIPLEGTVEQALDRGDLEVLRALQHKIARTIDGSKSGRDIASLSRQLREINEELARLEEVGDGYDLINELRRKHAASGF